MLAGTGLAGLEIDEQPLTDEDKQRRLKERQIRRDAPYFSDAARLMAELVLESLPANDPERAVHTELIRALRENHRAEYQEWLEREPALAAELAGAGRSRIHRLSKMLAVQLFAETN